ncbi:MAG: Fe-Mn family superoxide dismutase [Eubacteriales bacterium]
MGERYYLQKLPYAYDELEPYLDRELLHAHHGMILQRAVDELNIALDGRPELQGMEAGELFARARRLPGGLREEVRFWAGCLFCHEYYFSSLTAPLQGFPCPSETLLRALRKDLGSYQGMLYDMKLLALQQRENGFLWLVSDRRTRALQPVLTPGYLLPDLSRHRPLLALDLWEHAYCLQYRADKAAYLNQLFCLLNWGLVEERYQGTH